MMRVVNGMARLSVLAIVSAVMIGALALVVWLRPHPEPIPQRERTSIDSLMVTAPIFTAHRDTLVRVESVYVTKSVQNRAQATIAAHAADSLRKLADEAQQAAATQGERSERWFAVAELRGHENDSLRSANTGLSIALSASDSARAAATNRASAAEQRLSATADLSQRLAKDVQQGDRCRILVVFSCPSRRSSFVIGGALGAAATYYAVRR